VRKDPDRPEQTRERRRVIERQAEVLRIAQLSRDHGASFLLALYPDNLNQLITPDSDGRQLTMRQEMTGFAQRNGLPVLDLTDALGDFKDPRARTMRLREDAHPSVTGHLAIAAALLDALSRGGLLAH